MSHILLIIDGMTDPNFRIADYPSMDSMQQLAPVDYSEGGRPETLACTLRILGLRQVPPHIRPIVEAYGAGLEVAPDDLWLRGSWYHIDEQGQPDRQESLDTFTLPTDTTADVEPHDLGQGHWLFRLREERYLCERLTLPTPFVTGKMGDLLPEGNETIRDYFSHLTTPRHRLIVWDKGVSSPLPQLREPSVIIAAEKVLLGLGKMLGWETVTHPALTGETDTDLGLLARLTLDAADRTDRVIVHINGADQAGHRRDEAGKRAFLRRIDNELLPLLLRSSHRLTLTSDHGCDPATGCHLPGPQPILCSGMTHLRGNEGYRKQVSSL